MHPFSVLTLGIFVAGYTTARWDLVTRLYELAIFAWDHGVIVSILILHLDLILSCFCLRLEHVLRISLTHAIDALYKGLHRPLSLLPSRHHPN